MSQPPCKDCGERPASPNPKYAGRCPQCRGKRDMYSKGKLCPDCGVAINNQAVQCETCAGRARRSRGQRTCAECEKAYEATPSHFRTYCSDTCRMIAQTRMSRIGGEHSHAFKGFRRLERNGYITLYMGKGKHRRREHIVFMEQKLGRRLKPGETVHHINMDKQDNRLENLLLVTHRQHRRVHHIMEVAWAREHGVNAFADAMALLKGENLIDLLQSR